MTNRLLAILILANFTLFGFSQAKFNTKIEFGKLKYVGHTILIDPGLGWKGYNLDNQQDALSINVSSGYLFNNVLYTGAGVGYLNFEGIHGLNVYADFDYHPMKSRLSLSLNNKIGYSHIWNQYDNGTGTILGEIGIKINYRLKNSTSIYFQIGAMATQQSLLIPFKMGVSF